MNQKQNFFLSFTAEYGGFFLLFLVGLFCMLTGLHQVSVQTEDEARRLAEESIRRGAITCYALEGTYPPSYDYLKEYYGIQVDEERFAIFYDVFASNIMPDITVIER